MAPLRPVFVSAHYSKRINPGFIDKPAHLPELIALGALAYDAEEENDAIEERIKKKEFDIGKFWDKTTVGWVHMAENIS